MEARELRIGNWVKSKIHGGIIEASAVSILSCEDKTPIVEPIPLNEGWIDGSKEQLQNAGYVIRKDEPGAFGKGGYVLMYESLEPPLLMGNVPFVHKLQNLYYALEDTELQFKTLG